MDGMILAQKCVSMAKKILSADAGWESYESGKEYVSASGHRIRIKRIWINAHGMRPVVRVEYEYLTESARNQKIWLPAENAYDTFVFDIMRDK